jgi:hypothetical protein
MPSYKTDIFCFECNGRAADLRLNVHLYLLCKIQGDLATDVWVQGGRKTISYIILQSSRFTASFF